MWRNSFRSVGAIIAGIAVLTAISFAIEAVADPLMMHLFPGALPNADALKRSLPAHLVMFAYTFLSVMAGGYVTAWISRLAPVRDAAIMGAIEVLLTAWAMHAFPHQAPLYSWIAGMVFCIPAAWLGGALRVRTAKSKAIPQPA
ncbi:MAG: hypothetical protein KGL02_09315 [Acidobacteriota bacterium]|nr:hypothetical protein [Acidobacteriota bacterium]MDE3170134.1 hypothetical protein [Acidobacteriota bacterium]